MKAKILIAHDPTELEDQINAFIKDGNTILKIEFSVGAFPQRADFYALLLYEK